VVVAVSPRAVDKRARPGNERNRTRLADTTAAGAIGDPADTASRPTDDGTEPIIAPQIPSES
jgi:hypothetical protein